jgi:outer membrane protein OmpA-like peptidoglycan-associated protein
MALSKKRANSSMLYVISKGIDASRITSKGYGESKIINHCKNGVKCSEAEHGQNRRTEFVITKM